MEGFGDLAGVLVDEEAIHLPADDAVLEQSCAVCGSSNSMPHPYKKNETMFFPRRSKCEYCHGIHLLLHGEMPWLESHLKHWGGQIQPMTGLGSLGSISSR